MKECIICRKEFKKNGYNQKCCSKECSKINHINLKKEYYKLDKYKEHVKLYRQTKHYKDNVIKKWNSSIAAKKSRIKYQQTDKFKNRLKDWKNSEEYRKYYRIRMKNFRLSEKGKKYNSLYKISNDYKRSMQKYNKSDKGKINRLKHKLNRRAFENNIIELFTAQDFLNKVKTYNGICPNCKHPFDNGIHKLTLDHIYSVIQAYKDFLKTGIKRIYTIDDVQPLCKSCNSKKGSKIIEPKDLNTEVILTN